MKTFKKLIFLLMLQISVYTYSQDNVGIGVPVPTEGLSIAKGLNIDHLNQNTGSGLIHGLKFGNTSTINQMVGISSNRAGAAPLYSLDFYTANQRRMMIDADGHVGINTNTPSIYFFEVGGTVRGSTLRSAGSVYAEGGSVNAGTNIVADANITAGGNITTGGNITASSGDIVATNGELKADGKGVVMSNNGTRQKVFTATVTLTINNLAAGTTSSSLGTVTFSAGTFSAAPSVFVGNVVAENGDYYKAMLVLENVTATNASIRIFNPSSVPISFANASWKIIAIGTF